MKNSAKPHNKEVVILTSPDPWGYILVNTIRKEFPVAGVVYERRPLRKKVAMLARRTKRVGAWKVVGQALFLLFDLVYLKRASRQKLHELFANEDTSFPPTPFLEVSNINGKETRDFLKRAAPAAVAVCGTSILRPPLLSLVGRFINIHAGITPKYRGVHGGFWAIYNRDIEHLGVTVHLVDEGVDTGEVLYQGRISLQPRWDTFWTIAAKQHLRGIELLLRALRDEKQKKPKAVALSRKESMQWYHPTIGEYLAWRRLLQSLS